MSDQPDRDLLAAEYTLGCLEGDEDALAVGLLERDPSFARAVADWQARLSPLSALATPMEPPADLWHRIDTATALPASNVIPLRRLRAWQFSAAGALAIAASLTLFVLTRDIATTYIAILAPIANTAPMLIATVEPDGSLRVRPTGLLDVPAGKDLELWALPRGETTPRSLGVLPASGRTLTTNLALGTQLLVSLEPRGGSPTGLPTGPVLYGGALTAVN